MQENQTPPVSRSTLRLTFEVSNGVVQLKSTERLPMITPPQFGAKPEAGKNGGFWIELRDEADAMLGHRLISPTQLNSVEVHSPDGKIRRVFGPVEKGVFEVLLPDVPNARAAVLMGDPVLMRAETERAGGVRAKSEGSSEIGRFVIPPAQERR